jgi:hypothetical protein
MFYVAYFWTVVSLMNRLTPRPVKDALSERTLSESQ